MIGDATDRDNLTFERQTLRDERPMYSGFQRINQKRTTFPGAPYQMNIECQRR